MRREVREQEKKGGEGREGEGERWEYPALPHPLAVFLLPSLCGGEGVEHAKVAVILR